MQTLTFGEDAPSYVTGLAKCSAIGSIALSALSNAAIIADENQIPFSTLGPQRMEQFDLTGYRTVPMPCARGIVPRDEAAQALSAFMTRLATGMQPAPAEIHREVSERPWDFV